MAGKHGGLARTLNSVLVLWKTIEHFVSFKKLNNQHRRRTFYQQKSRRLHMSLHSFFFKASISCSFPNNPASDDKAGSRKHRGLVGVCPSSQPVLREQRREITINDTCLEQRWLSDKTTLYPPLVNESRSPCALSLCVTV